MTKNNHQTPETALARMRQGEEPYRLLFEHNPQPMWVYDLDTLKFLAVNDAAIHHYGYSREWFLSMTIKDIRPVEDIPALLDTIARSPGKGLDTSGVWRHRKKDGHLIYVDIVSHPLPFGDRRGKLVLATDITERRRVEEALRQSEERYRRIIETTHEGIWMSDLKGVTTFVNATDGADARFHTGGDGGPRQSSSSFLRRTMPPSDSTSPSFCKSQPANGSRSASATQMAASAGRW